MTVRCLHCNHRRDISDVEHRCALANPRSVYCARCLSRDVKLEEGTTDANTANTAKTTTA